MSDRISLVRDTVSVMRDLGVRRLRMPDGFEVELADSAPAPRDLVPPGVAYSPPVEYSPPAETTTTTPPPLEPEDLCVCGHDNVTEHNEHGCLYSCTVATCTTKPQEAPKEG